MGVVTCLDLLLCNQRVAWVDPDSMRWLGEDVRHPGALPALEAKGSGSGRMDDFS